MNKHNIAVHTLINVYDGNGFILKGKGYIDEVIKIIDENKKMISNGDTNFTIISDDIDKLSTKIGLHLEVTVRYLNCDGEEEKHEEYLIDHIHINNISGNKAHCYITAGGRGYIYKK